MHRSGIAPAVAAATVAIILTGCSSGGSANKSSGSNSTASAAANSPLHSALPADVQKSGTLTMATDATIGAPFASFGSDNKSVVGLNVDVAQALGQVMGIQVKIVNTPFGTFIPGLQAKRYDFSVSVMLDTRKREKVVDFVDYIKDGSGFLVRAADTHTSLGLADLCGVRAAAISGSVEQQDLATQSTKCTSAGKKPVAISIFPENAQGILALTSSRVDVWVGDSDQNAWLKQQNNGTVTQSGVPFDAAIDGIAVLKGNPIVPVLQKATQMLMDNGTYSKILTKYGVQDSAISPATLNNAQY